MSDELFTVPQDWRARAYIDAHKYEEMYARAERDPTASGATRPSASTG